MKKVIKRLSIILVVIIAVVSIGFILWVRDRYVVPILTYHHVESHIDKGVDLNSVSVKAFEAQMFFLKKHGYRVISFEDLVEGINKGHSFSRNTVVIHFDDGYSDNYTNAFPILKKYQFPAMVFLISDSIGTPRYLTWDQIEEMESYDFWVGAHTRTHPYLPDITLEKAEDEIVGSKRIIEEHVGHPIDYFVYPSGGFTSEVQNIVKEAGYKAAGTTNRGYARFNEDLYALKRIRMNENDTRIMGVVMWAKCSGYYNLFRKSRDGGSKKILLKQKGQYE